MIRLAKYLKPYLLLIVIAIACCSCRRMPIWRYRTICRISSTLGSNRRVVNAVPTAIRQSEMNRVLAFMSSDNQKAVLADYSLVNKDSADYATEVKLYPVLATEPVYVLNKVDQSEITKLNPIMGKALWWFRH